MEKLFINLVRMSVSASYLILAVLAVRLVLRRAPKRMRSFLWLLVGIRLVIPFSVESIFSLIPSTQAVDRYIYETAQADAAVQTPVPDASKPAGVSAEHPFTHPAVSSTDKGQTVAV
ncbi:MAG: M56 family metallopeptidase, partial [Lachnospiraceae bacterium]|nr:M56 family metallopeptidase [Lachnospiraceae bacterium]